MDKQAFKQRMQNLKSYRENNPGKGYWDWKVQAYQNGGRHALGVGQVFASLADMLFNKERRTPAIAAAAYYTIHQTQNDPVLAPVEAPLVEPIADAIKSVDETPYDPGEVFLLSPENQKKQMTKNPNYRVVDTNSEEDPYGIVRRAANYHKEIHGEVPVYEYIADSDTTIKRSNLIPVGTLPLGEYTPELPHAGNNVFYQMTKDLTKRVGDKHDDYFLLPTEQKAHMNQLREWMFQNGYINRRDQKVTPEYMSKIMKQLNNVEGMKGVQRAAQQFKSNKTFTKWFNSVPLIGAGLLGVNKYFTDEDKQEK